MHIGGPSLCQHPVSVEVQNQGVERGLSPRPNWGGLSGREGVRWMSTKFGNNRKPRERMEPFVIELRRCNVGIFEREGREESQPYTLFDP